MYNMQQCFIIEMVGAACNFSNITYTLVPLGVFAWIKHYDALYKAQMDTHLLVYNVTETRG
jgi:hypothetical protein